jgi:hypothetical protein
MRAARPTAYFIGILPFSPRIAEISSWFDERQAGAIHALDYRPPNGD